MLKAFVLYFQMNNLQSTILSFGETQKSSISKERKRAMEAATFKITLIKVAVLYSLFAILVLFVGIGFIIYHHRNLENERHLKLGNRWVAVIFIDLVAWFILILYINHIY